MSITFAVDAVTPVLDRLPTIPLRAASARLIGTDLEVVSHDGDVVDDAMAGLLGKRVHPLIACVHRAFAEHRPLTLSPDHIWLTIASGFADHVDEHAEVLRERLVRHDGRAALIVSVTARPQTPAQWHDVVNGFAGQIAEHTGPGLVRLLGCDFSTTTTVEQIASRVVTMAALKKYFDYRVVCICGIPRITLEGTVEDWREIRRRLDVLAEYDLQWWAAALRPVCDALVDTAAGRPDPDFWRSIYKPEEAYGGDVATGWLMRLFPYHHSIDGRRSRSRIFDELGGVVGVPVRPTRLQRLLRRVPAPNPWVSDGVSPSSPGAGLSVAPIVMSAAGPAQETLRLYAGFCGFRQQADGALRPEVVWGVGPPPPSTMVIDRLLARAGTGVVERVVNVDQSDEIEETPAALCELYDRCNGLEVDGVVLWPRAAVTRGTYTTAFGVVDGQQISFAFGHQDQAFVVVGAEGAHPEDTAVVADSIDEFFSLLAAGLPLTPRGTLYERLHAYVDVLRTVLERGEGPPRNDLSPRELVRLAMRLRGPDGTPRQRAYWWACLVATLKLTAPREHYFRARELPDELFERLGIQDEL